MAKRSTYATITPILTDLLSATDDPGGTPLTRNVVISALMTLFDANFTRAAAIMSVQAGSSAEGTTDATPRKIAAWNTDGLENNMTVDSTTGNDITAGIAGTYVVMISCSFLGTGNKEYQIEIYKNGSATGFAADRKLGSGGDVGAVTIHGLLALSATDTVELYHSSSDGGSLFTVKEAQLTAIRVGP